MGLHHNHFVRINTDELINEEGADYVLDIHNGKACLYLKEGMACVEYNRDDKKLSEYYLNPDRKDECANWEATWGFFLMLMRKIYILHMPSYMEEVLS